MTPPRGRGALCAALALFGLVTAATPAGGRSPAGEVAAGARSITLVTGDRVVLTGDQVGSLTGGPGRERAVFHTFRRDGHLHVVPRDAAHDLARGRLDPRLFDVTALLEAGYDRRPTIPLIVVGDPGLPRTKTLDAVGAVAVEVPKGGAADAWRTLVSRASVRKVWLDGLRRPSLDRSTAQIGAPAAWSAGYTGEGVKVAVLDTGIDDGHPDLAGRVAARSNFTTDPDNTDRVGHGTHVAAAIGSRHAVYRGVAPDAELLDGKVCVAAGCPESAILAGVQWAVGQGADVVNLSLGGPDTPETDPLEAAVEALSARALFVVAAGNSGRPGTVSSPGSADAALTVGAVDRAEGIAEFSSRGPRPDGGVKPDVTAPGVDIAAAKAEHGTIGTPVDATHVALSGTSMATPHVAGAAALLAQQHPDWSGARLKAALVASARPNPALTAFDQGAGRVDLAAAITTTVTADPANVALGLQKWPHDDDTPVTKNVVYRNTGTAPVTLRPSAVVTAPDGKPSDVVTVSPAEVTVPPGGDATIAVTADTRRAPVDGVYAGTIVATGGATPLRVPVSVHREVESYDVTFRFVDAAGNPAKNYYASVIGMDNSTFVFLFSADGKVSLRVSKGDYFVGADVTTDRKVALLPRPDLSVTADTTVVVDARTARPVRITAPDPKAREVLGDLTTARRRGDRSASVSTAFLGGFGTDVSIGHNGPDLPGEELTALLGAQLSGTPAGPTPVTYRFAWALHGRLPTGFARAVPAEDLAEVRTSYGAGPAGSTYGHVGNPAAPDGTTGWGWMPAVAGASVDRVGTEGVGWSWGFQQTAADGSTALSLVAPERSYRKGSTVQERFNDPVFSPVLPVGRPTSLARKGDEIGFGLPLFGDGAGNGGSSAVSSARTTLLRDGVRVGETAFPGNGLFKVPGGAADYRVETEAARPAGVSEFATRVAAAWTFRSDTAPGGELRPLPLTVVRFAPELTAGSAPRGAELRVPLVVRQQATDGIGRLDVEVSFDDGRTWAAVPVSDGVARVANPDAAGFASLRVRASDRVGNTAEHTVIRAYKIV
ncbi:S8 family serine peptidase [Actinosynnema sp. NPDC047251]|uniref:Peptidase S8/S53, subtilisin kexin sedolisin n=1 Tax=Saccharothrix espanaensis (strain ATCC 51144 / DSM 44229 / JCM 9112 / NBRC 15066 / NRRL 15764) TaxID=1179773 RepID=K0JTF5_SACES|nr:S8 family serine peptidase [Saccharothrix espanaensis]CCH29186.1 Peptidase S8/S53, subtilisin kexin sedolisin [Saccharothrix espanaensis DSM 44229]